MVYFGNEPGTYRTYKERKKRSWVYHAFQLFMVLVIFLLFLAWYIPSWGGGTSLLRMILSVFN